jgi:hypothetical protein
LRVVVWIVSAFVLVVLIALPVARVLMAGDGGTDRDDAARDARQFVADRFAEDAFERRASDAAARWALPELRDDVDDLVGELQSRPSVDLAGAAASTANVGCSVPVGQDAECFHAWLRKPGTAELVRVRLVIDIVNGQATIVDIERVEVA